MYVCVVFMHVCVCVCVSIFRCMVWREDKS